MSLLEYLAKKSEDSTEEAFRDMVEVAEKLFRGFSKAITIKTPVININGREIVQSLEEEKKATFLQLKDKFKNEFEGWESKITKNKPNNYNIVFIDDLDRCEPENVLNLLSALKLFFTYGQKTIFFCGIDKKAVNEAVKTKYGKVVKANEYLEKIFDISFTMPEYDDLLKLVSFYFDERKVESIEGKLNENISEFFKAIKFTNPRRVKKLLNKFQMLRSVKENHCYNNGMPNIYVKNGGNYLETILSLYFIILHEFYPLIFDNLFDFKKKESSYLKAIKNFIELNPTDHYPNHRRDVIEKIDNNFTNFSLDKIKNEINFEKFSFVFLPTKVEELNWRSFESENFYSFKVNEKNIEFRFVEYFHSKEKIFNNLETLSSITLNGLKEMIKKTL